MNKLVTYGCSVALLTGGLAACATDQGQFATIPPATAQAPSQTVEGQVIRDEGDAYIIREPSGRQTRVFLNKNSVSDSPVVGDPVVVHYDSSTGSATSIRRATISPAASTSAMPERQTIEGVVQRLEGNDYVIKDQSGKEVRLNVDHTTRLDGNVTAGDRVVAVTNPLASRNPYVTNMFILGSPGVVQGEIVRIDGSAYVVRDLSGREIRLNTNAATVRNGNAMVGDRIVAYLGPSTAVHADSIARR